jgi:hypothetical protein
MVEHSAVKSGGFRTVGSAHRRNWPPETAKLAPILCLSKFSVSTVDGFTISTINGAEGARDMGKCTRPPAFMLRFGSLGRMGKLA